MPTVVDPALFGLMLLGGESGLIALFAASLLIRARGMVKLRPSAATTTSLVATAPANTHCTFPIRASERHRSYTQAVNAQGMTASGHGLPASTFASTGSSTALDS